MHVGSEVGHATEQVAHCTDAIDPTSYAAVFTTPRHLIEGAWLEPDDKDGIVLGIGVAGADPGDAADSTPRRSLKTVHWRPRTSPWPRRAIDFVVRGVYQNTFPLSDSGAFITLTAADSLASTTDVSEQLRTTFDALDQLTSTLRTASTESAALAGGARGVSTAIGSLASSADSLASSASSVDAGASRLSSSAAAIASSASELAAAGRSFAEGLQAAATTLAKPAVDSASASAAAAGAAATDAAELVASCPASTPAYCAAIVRHATLSKDAAAAASTSAKATAALAGAVTRAATSATALADGLERLSAATRELASAAAQLADGTAGVATGAARLASAANQVDGSAHEVASGAEALAAALASGADVTGPSKADRDATLAKLDALGTPPGHDSFTRVVATIAPGADSEVVQQRIASLRSRVQVQGPAQLAAAIQDQLDTFELIDRIMRVMSLVVAAITVIIITYVDLANRRRQDRSRATHRYPSALIATASRASVQVVTALAGTVIGYLLFRFVLCADPCRAPFQFLSGPAFRRSAMSCRR
ncbi:MAG: ABC transporter permease [Actinobacteria bacterium]|nr:ABC transporter permease [Actinomycetota bacterium]